MSDDRQVPKFILDAFAEARQDALKKIAADLEELQRLRPIMRELAGRADECYPDTGGHCGCHYNLDELAHRAAKALAPAATTEPKP